MKVNGERVKWMEEGLIFGQMEDSIMENTWMTRNKDMVFIYGQMEEVLIYELNYRVWRILG